MEDYDEWSESLRKASDLSGLVCIHSTVTVVPDVYIAQLYCRVLYNL